MYCPSTPCLRRLSLQDLPFVLHVFDCHVPPLTEKHAATWTERSLDPEVLAPVFGFVAERKGRLAYNSPCIGTALLFFDILVPKLGWLPF